MWLPFPASSHCAVCFQHSSLFFCCLAAVFGGTASLVTMSRKCKPLSLKDRQDVVRTCREPKEEARGLSMQASLPVQRRLYYTAKCVSEKWPNSRPPVSPVDQGPQSQHSTVVWTLSYPFPLTSLCTFTSVSQRRFTETTGTIYRVCRAFARWQSYASMFRAYRTRSFSVDPPCGAHRRTKLRRPFCSH